MNNCTEFVLPLPQGLKLREKEVNICFYENVRRYSSYELYMHVCTLHTFQKNLIYITNYFLNSYLGFIS